MKVKDFFKKRVVKVIEVVRKNEKALKEKIGIFDAPKLEDFVEGLSQINQSVSNTKLNYQLSSNASNQVQKLFSKMKEFQVEADEKVLLISLNICTKIDNIPLAIKCLEFLPPKLNQQPKYQPIFAWLNKVSNEKSKLATLTKQVLIESLLGKKSVHQDKLSSLHFTARKLIYLYHQRGLHSTAHTYVELLFKLEKSMSYGTLKPLAEAFLQEGKFEESLEILQRMKKHFNCLPTADFFEMFLGQVKVFMGSHPSDKLFDSLYKAVCWASEMQYEMEGLGHHELVSLAIEVGDKERMIRVYEIIHNSKHSPPYNAKEMVNFFESVGENKLASLVSHYLSNFRPEKEKYLENLVSKIKTAKEMDYVRSLFREMLKKGYRPPYRVLDVLFEPDSKMDPLISLLFTKQLYPPTQETYLRCLRLLARSERWGTLESIAEESLFRNGPSLGFFLSMLDIYAGAADARMAQKWYERMEESQVEPDFECNKRMMLCYANCGDLNAAMHWVKKLPSSHIPPSLCLSLYNLSPSLMLKGLEAQRQKNPVLPV